MCLIIIIITHDEEKLKIGENTNVDCENYINLPYKRYSRTIIAKIRPGSVFLLP